VAVEQEMEHLEELLTRRGRVMAVMVALDLLRPHLARRFFTVLEVEVE
jgi:hypothetical protein